MEKTRDAALRVKEIVEPTNGRLDINDIMKMLPHRYPFLMVDKIVECEKGRRIVGIKNVTVNEEFFKGHFPDNPIMPGVLILEGLAQTGGLLTFSNEASAGKSIYFAGLNDVKFRKAVIPGDVLKFEVSIKNIRSRLAILRGVATVDSETVAEADIIFGMAG